MKLLPPSISGRILALLFAGLIVLHLSGISIYHLGLKAELDVTNDQHLAEQMASVKRAIAREPPATREDLAHALSGAPLEIHWNETQTAPPPGASTNFHSLKQRLLSIAPELKEEDVSIRAAATLPEHATATRRLLVSIRLDDGSWANITATRNTEPEAGLNKVALSTTVMALGVTAAAAFLIRHLTRTLRLLADAANRLDQDGEPMPVVETGPSEVRALGMAFNNMVKRVQHLVDDRTQMLAAISHDLRTPLTRLRLHTEDIADPGLARAVTTDLAEMETTLDSALALLRGDRLDEETKPIDLCSLLETISTDLADLGHDVTLTRTAAVVVVRGGHLALKRAFRNLVENFIKCGIRARITVEGRADGAVIFIDDDGPSILQAKKETAFRPFYRIDDSRNREMGGVGLGLTVARSIIQSHGGELTITNRDLGGLRATVRLPK